MQDSIISGNSRYIWGDMFTRSAADTREIHLPCVPLYRHQKSRFQKKTFFKNLKNQTNLTNIEVQFSTLTHRNFRPVIRDFFGKKFLSKWLSNKILSKQAETFDIKANSILQIYKKPAQKFIQNMPENHIFGTKKLTRKLIQKAELD